MKTLIVSLFALALSSNAFASFFQVCDLTAKIQDVSKISVFGKGSAKVPAGLNPDGQAVDTFKSLVKFQVLEVATTYGHPGCENLVGEVLDVLLDSSADLKGKQVGDEVKLQRRSANSLTPYGVASSETVSFLE